MLAVGGKTNRADCSPNSFPSDDAIFGCTAQMRRIRRDLEKVCATALPVLIQGEAGTGKKVLAKWIHHHSPRSQNALVKVNCAAIPGMLLESELFGYEKGAFTGAHSAKPGRIELAQGGTLLFDQLTDLDLVLQAKLLQMLQDGRFTRLGGEEEKRVDARVICTCDSRIEEFVAAGKFRSDLFYRINVFRIRLPRLAQRREDIPFLAQYLSEQLSRRFDRELPTLSPDLLHALQGGEWKGNIRELENRIASHILLGMEETSGNPNGNGRSFSFAEENQTIPLKQIASQACRELSRQVVLRALQANRWNRRRTAEELKISYRALLYKIRLDGLAPKRPQRQRAGTPDPAPLPRGLSSE
jgi:two-component system response regulator AtoC